MNPEVIRTSNFVADAAGFILEQARLALGKLFIRSQRWAEAVVELEKVIQLDPNLNEAYYQLGLAYGRLKRTADAQATMATFKRLSDEEKKRDSDELHEVVKRLSNVKF